MRFLHPGRFFGTKIPSPQLLLFPRLANRDVRNPFRFRSCENCRGVVPVFPFWNSPSAQSRSFPVVDPLSFHVFTKCSSSNPFLLLWMHSNGGVYPPSHNLLPRCLRLFAALPRIPVRMSASISCLAPQRSS